MFLFIYYPADVTQPCEHTSCLRLSVQSMSAIGGMLWKCGVGRFSLLVLVEAASLVSRGRLPVLARQLSGHQDCKSTLLRL